MHKTHSLALVMRLNRAAKLNGEVELRQFRQRFVIDEIRRRLVV